MSSNSSTEVGLFLVDKKEQLMALIKQASSLVIKTQQDYNAAKGYLKDIIEAKKDIEADYKEHPVVVAAREIQRRKKELTDAAESARDALKNGQMLEYEREVARRIREEEQHQQELARKAAEEARKKELAEQKAAWEAAEKARKEAMKRNDEEAAARAAAEAEAIKQDAREIKNSEIVVPVVVLEKPKTVTRRKVWVWRAKLKNGVEISKGDFKASVRVRPDELPGTDPRYFALDPQAISAVVDSQGKNHGIKNIEAWEKEV